MHEANDIFREDITFSGFDVPVSNFFRLPNNWTDITAGITSLAELKVVEYVARHTWGFQEFGIRKKITSDEFEHGRKKSDGSRMDHGTGLSKKSIIDGLRRAVEAGYLGEDFNDRDLGRIEKSYWLKMKGDDKESSGKSKGTTPTPKNSTDEVDQGNTENVAQQREVKNLHPSVNNLPSGVKNLHPRGVDSSPRTEKENQERKVINVNENFKKREGETKLKYLPNLRYSSNQVEDIADKLVQRLDDPGSRDYLRLVASKISEARLSRIFDKLARKKHIRNLAAVFSSEIEAFAKDQLENQQVALPSELHEMAQKMQKNMSTF